MPPSVPGAWKPPGRRSTAVQNAAGVLELERRLEEVEHAAQLAEWALYAGRSTTLGRVFARKGRLLSDPNLLDWCARARDTANRPILARRAELLRRTVLDSQLEHHPSVLGPRSSMEGRLARFRPRLRGKSLSESELFERMSREPDRSVRRDGYYAAERFRRSLERPLRSLIAARNARAQSLGFRDYPDARLGLEGLDVPSLLRITRPFGRLARRAAARVRDRFQDRTGDRGWYPWDYDWIHGQELYARTRGFPAGDLVASARRTARAWGFTARETSFRLTRVDSPFAGLEFGIDPPADVRIIARPRPGYINYVVFLHETGHAVHSRCVRGGAPILRRHFGPSFAGFEEGIGSLFESIASEVSWLRQRPGISGSEASEVHDRAVEGLAIDLARTAARVRCELQLYRDPEFDATGELGRWTTRTLGFDSHRGLSWVDPFYVAPPLYRQSYLLAAAFEGQIRSYSRELIPGPFWPNPRVGRWLRRVWMEPGAREDWLPKVREITGSPLGPGAFLESQRQELGG